MRWWVAFWIVVGSLAASAQAQESEARTRYAQGVSAYREGDASTALNVWRQLYHRGAEDLDPGALAYNLGNASFRLGRFLEAAAWYQQSVLYAPRDADAWVNLELARERAGLEPADRGDLNDTLERLLFALTPQEAERAVALLGLLLAATLAARAWWGGRTLRRAAWGLAAITALACMPWGVGLVRGELPGLAIIESGGAELRSEPRPDAALVGRAEAGARVERTDALPGWVRARSGGSLAGWLRAESVCDLGFGSAADQVALP